MTGKLRYPLTLSLSHAGERGIEEKARLPHGVYPEFVLE
jgi:hypothetical protein